MLKNRIDYTHLIGKRYLKTRLVVLEEFTIDEGPLGIKRKFRCQCDCGKIHVTTPRLLIKGDVRSCGCRHKRHRGSYEKLYRVWAGILVRCRNPNDTAYRNYGGRGIAVCKEWEDYATFRAWAMENGYRPELQIDRRDNDGNYSPTNCRFVTKKENNRNTRKNVFLTWAGLTMTIAEWSGKTGLSQGVIGHRKRIGWSDGRTLTTPLLREKKRVCSPNNPPAPVPPTP